MNVNKEEQARKVEEDSYSYMKTLRSRGWSTRSIAELMGWSSGTVHRVTRSKNRDDYIESIRVNNIKARKRKASKANAAAEEQEIQHLYDTGHTTHQIRAKLNISKRVIPRINNTRRRNGTPPMVQKTVCQKEVKPTIFISEGIQHIAYLLERMEAELQSLSMVQTDWCVEWADGTAALQKSLRLFRRRVMNTSHKRSYE